MPVTERKLAARLPAEWLDRLLVAVCESEPGQDPEDAIGAVLDAAAAFAPHAAFGVRVPDPRLSAPPQSAHGSGQPPVVPMLVVRRSAMLISPEAPQDGPLFPELACENQFPVDFESSGSPAASSTPNSRSHWGSGSPAASSAPNSRSHWGSGSPAASFAPNPEGVLAIASNDPSELPGAAVGTALVSRLALAVGAALRTSRQTAPVSARIAAGGAVRRHAVHTDKLAGLGKVVAGVVHELNNPVTSILAYAEYLRRKAERGPLDAADIDRLGRIEEAARRIHVFSRDLVAYARPSTEVPVPLVIHDVIDRALMFCEHILEPTRVTVERAFGDVALIRGVGSELAQVFVNLFTNAVTAMSDSGGTLRIETSLDDGGASVHVLVTDTGRGIGEHALPRIFEPFYTTDEHGQGTGLGLSIVRDIVEAHQGRVWAERREGSGAAFHLVLPAAEE